MTSPISSASNKANTIRQSGNRLAHAKKALEEAKSRREKIDVATTNSANEKNGRGGLDPARYGDWENKGISSDF